MDLNKSLKSRLHHQFIKRKEKSPRIAVDMNDDIVQELQETGAHWMDTPSREDPNTPSKNDSIILIPDTPRLAL